jgi:hypothetical protein
LASAISGTLQVQARDWISTYLPPTWAGVPRYGVNHMPRTTTLLAAIVMLGLPLAAQAQAPTASGADLSYCAKLSDLYQRYLGPEYSGRMDTTPNVAGGEAVAKCQQGDAAASIPVLERLLSSAGFTLPRHG